MLDTEENSNNDRRRYINTPYEPIYLSIDESGEKTHNERQIPNKEETVVHANRKNLIKHDPSSKVDEEDEDMVRSLIDDAKRDPTNSFISRRQLSK